MRLQILLACAMTHLVQCCNLCQISYMMQTRARNTLPRLDESLLMHLTPFASLIREQIHTILDQASVQRHEKGASIFHEGDPAERFFLLLDGCLRVVRITLSGEQVTALHIPAGQLFGIARALGRDTYPATAIAAAESLTLSWPMRLWESYAAEYEGFATATYKAVGHRLEEMNLRLVEMATQQVEQRVANAVLRLVNVAGRKVEDGIEIDFPITRQDLSELTATTLHTVSRLLSAWEKQGLIESRRKHIKVCNPHGLVVIAQG